MKKRILAVVLCLCMTVACTFAFAGCGSQLGEADSRMTVDINPSVEFILDSNNKVISVTGLNDDGNLVIAGEAFVGKTAEEAAKMMVSIATDAGYLVKGSAEVNENGVKISITGDEEAAKELYSKVEGKVKSFLESEGVTAAVEQVKGLSTEALRALVKAVNPELTEEQLNAMTQEELLKSLNETRKESQALLSDSLKEAYYKAKAYQVDFAGREETAKLIEDVNSAYQEMVARYKKMMGDYQKAIQSVEQMRYNMFVKSDSQYQQALKSVMDKKAEWIEKRAEAANATGADKIMKESLATAAKTALEMAQTTLETAYKLANTAIDGVLETMTSVQTELVKLEEKFPEEIKTTLQNKANSLQSAMNKAKNDAFDKFEKEYAADIQARLNSLKETKAKMIEANQKA